MVGKIQSNKDRLLSGAFQDGTIEDSGADIDYLKSLVIDDVMACKCERFEEGHQS